MPALLRSRRPGVRRATYDSSRLPLPTSRPSAPSPLDTGVRQQPRVHGGAAHARRHPQHLLRVAGDRLEATTSLTIRSTSNRVTCTGWPLPSRGRMCARSAERARACVEVAAPRRRPATARPTAQAAPARSGKIHSRSPARCAARRRTAARRPSCGTTRCGGGRRRRSGWPHGLALRSRRYWMLIAGMPNPSCSGSGLPRSCQHPVRNWPNLCMTSRLVVGPTGFEPVTSRV